MAERIGRHPVIVHVGYVRTGTTMHQKHVFSGNERIHYIGKPFSDEAVMRAFRDLACRDTANFDAALSNRILLESAALPGRSRASCTVLSDEIMLTPQSVDFDVLIDRLSAAFGEIKVLMTIRGQYEVFRSWCEHILKKGEYGCLETIVKYQYKFRNTRGSMISFMDYNKYYSLLCEKLGRDRVMMLPYELMHRDPDTYAKLLAEFLGVTDESILANIASAPVLNSRWSAGDISYLDFRKRHLSGRRHRIMDRAGLVLFRGFPIGRRRIERMMHELRNEFADEFAPKNVSLREALIDRLGVDIAELGYFLPENRNDRSVKAT